MVDMISRKGINLNTVAFVVLDEADEMLNMGFKEDLDTILSETSPEKATFLFSATMPKEVERIARNYMNEPMQITVGKRNAGASNIEHMYYVVHSRDRYNALKRVVDYHPEIFGIIFCRTKIETQEVADKLIRDGYSADALHGDLSQQQRDIVMKRFRSHQVQMLVATDVAARGIDVDDVTHVINYNLPDEIENYTHRSGRTARAGKHGISVVIINIKESGRIRDIERIVGKPFRKMQIPTGVEVCEKQLFALIEKIHDVEVNEEGIAQYLPRILEHLKDVSKEELIKRFVSDEFKRFLDYYKNAPDLNVENRNVERERDRSGKQHSRFFISVGLMDGLDKGQLLRFICDTTNLEGSNIGRIELKHSFSFFEVESELEDILQHAFADVTFRGRKVKVELSTNPGGGGGGERREHRGGGGGGYGGKKKFYRNDNRGENRSENRSENRGEGGGGGGGYDRKKKFFKRKDRD
jgi:ATP-dependent RNA helicase DeaD